MLPCIKDVLSGEKLVKTGIVSYSKTPEILLVVGDSHFPAGSLSTNEPLSIYVYTRYPTHVAL